MLLKAIDTHQTTYLDNYLLSPKSKIVLEAFILLNLENYLNKCLYVHLLNLNYYLCITEFNILFIICEYY